MAPLNPTTLTVRAPAPTAADEDATYADAVAVLNTMDAIIIAVFFFEITLKVVGQGLQPWRFFFTAWCASLVALRCVTLEIA